MEPLKHIRIAVIDDHELFRRGITRLINNIEHFSVIAEFEDGTSLTESLLEIAVDLLLLDVQLPDTEPQELLQKIRELRPELPILYLTMMRGHRVFRKLERQGISGYILKDITLAELETAITTVANGGTYFTEDIYLNDTIQPSTVTTPKNKMYELLSPREQEILILICKEYSSAAIAKLLFVSVSTVDTHRKNLMQKLGVSNTVGLVKYAIQNGIFTDV